ncbi:hypothetical protein ACWCPV_35350, partial [Streptomyces tubercidicus]
MNGPGTGTGGTGTGRTGDGPDLDGTASVRPVEDRLQRAFAARAESIGIRDLRPAAPPDVDDLFADRQGRRGQHRVRSVPGVDEVPAR